MKNATFAKTFISGNTSLNGKTKQSVNIVSRVIEGVLCASYYYHSSLIASIEGDKLTLQWCGFYTLSTARHLNHVLNAVGDLMGDNKGYHKQRVSYANDRDRGIASRVYIKENNQWKVSEVVYCDGRRESITASIEG